MGERPEQVRIAVAIPCLNEEITVGTVVRDFMRVLPEAGIYVIDNGSEDRTAEIAREAGAIVLQEKRPGKGWAIQRVFEVVDADLYVIADGDSTYPAGEVRNLLAPLLGNEADMVVGNRLDRATSDSLKGLHRFGNWFIVSLLNFCFRAGLRDVLSGYRAVNRRFAQRIPLLTTGFEIETEMTIQALERNLVIKEVGINYHPRPKGSKSKLKTFQDGYRIILTIAILLRDHRPLFFFSGLACCVFLAAAVPGIALLGEYLGFGEVRSLANLAGFGLLLILGILFMITGLILNTINTRMRELTSLLFRKGPSDRVDDAGRFS